MRYFFLLAAFLSWPVLLFSQGDNRKLLDELDLAIAGKSQFEVIKKKQISLLNKKLAKVGPDMYVEQFGILSELYQSHFTFDYDSAMYIAFRMRDIASHLNDEARIAESKLKIGVNLLASGIFGEARDTLSTVKVRFLNDSLKVEYYYTFARTFFDMGDNYEKPFYRDKFNLTGLHYLDSAIALLDSGNSDYFSLKGLKYVRETDFERAAEQYAYLYKNFKSYGRQYAIDASTYGYVLEQRGFLVEGIGWYIRAAIQDIKMANKENVALLNLANKLFEQGNIEKSSEYLNIAFADAMSFGAIQRKFQILAIQPIVEAARLNMAEKQKTRIKRYATAVTVLSVLVIIILFLLFRQLQNVKAARNEINKTNNVLQEINNKLREVNLIKEEYIGFFFKTNSDLIDKLDNYRQSIENKITLNKIGELTSLITMKNIRQEREALFSSFDTAFLNIFPDFIHKYNDMFKPEDRLIPNNSKQMNTDIRIFALIRLGIFDTEKIARILNYSVNTINTYKTRTKNLSLIANEEFEKEILKIQSI